MYKCSAAPVSLLFPFFVLRLLQSHQSLFPIFNLIYAQLLFTVRGRSCAEGRRGRCKGVWLTRSPCRATAAAGRGGGSSCARCKATAGSSHSSPPPTGTGCGASAAAGKAPSHSWGRWCSPWRRRRRWTWAAPVVPACSRCRTRQCCRGWWEGRSDGRCRAGSCNTETENNSAQKVLTRFTAVLSNLITTGQLTPHSEAASLSTCQR